MTPPERRKDNLYKTLLIMMCGLSGAGGGWGGSKISQAELQRMIEAQGRSIQEVKAEVFDLRVRKVDREENSNADALQDKRIDAIQVQLESIHADIRALIQMQGRR
jgi:hypothetical protein